VSFKPLMAIIGPTGLLVAMSMILKTLKQNIHTWQWQLHACTDTPSLCQIIQIFACVVGSPT